MSELVDAETMAVAFLKPILAPTRVATQTPATLPDVFVRAWRNGGTADNRIVDNPVITVDVYAKTTADCAALATQLRNAFLNGYTAMPLVRGVREISGPASTPDTTANRNRYRFSVQLTTRAKRA